MLLLKFENAALSKNRTWKEIHQNEANKKKGAVQTNRNFYKEQVRVELFRNFLDSQLFSYLIILLSSMFLTFIL